MAVSNFLQFDSLGINKQTDDLYTVDPLRVNGIQTNAILPSPIDNKIFNQSSTFVAAFTQMMAAKGYPMSDASLAALITQLSNVMTQSELGPLSSVVYRSNDRIVMTNLSPSFPPYKVWLVPLPVLGTDSMVRLSFNVRVINEPVFSQIGVLLNSTTFDYEVISPTNAYNNAGLNVTMYIANRGATNTQLFVYTVKTISNALVSSNTEIFDHNIISSIGVGFQPSAPAATYYFERLVVEYIA